MYTTSCMYVHPFLHMHFEDVLLFVARELQHSFLPLSVHKSHHELGFVFSFSLPRQAYVAFLYFTFGPRKTVGKVSHLMKLLCGVAKASVSWVCCFEQINVLLTLRCSWLTGTKKQNRFLDPNSNCSKHIDLDSWSYSGTEGQYT